MHFGQECVCVCVCVHVCASTCTHMLSHSVVSDSLQSHVGCSLPDSLFMGFSRQEYWSGQPFPSLGSSLPRDGTQVSYTAGRFFPTWATREALGQEYCRSSVASLVRCIVLLISSAIGNFNFIWLKWCWVSPLWSYYFCFVISKYFVGRYFLSM